MSKTARDPYVHLARATLEDYLAKGEVIAPPADLPPEMTRRGGTFVSLKKRGKLRGCIGTFLPTEETVAHEIVANAIKAATKDPRFPPVEADELEEIDVSVDVLSPPEPCSEEELDPRLYGVIVESVWRRGLLLPDLEGVDTVSEQVRIARMKAGIGPREPVRLLRFTVERHVEHGD